MSKVYHFVRRTRYWLDTDDEQHLKLFLYIENTHTSPITVTVDWSWAGSGSDPYGIDGVSESKTLQPGEIWQNVKDLLRNPPIDVGATTTDKIIADVKTTIDSVEYIKEVQFIPTIYRRLPEYQLWNFDDGTFQGWERCEGSVTITSQHSKSSPYSLYFNRGTGSYTYDSPTGNLRLPGAPDSSEYYYQLYRNFNLNGVKSATISFWVMRNSTSGFKFRICIIDVDDWTVYLNEEYTIPDSFTWHKLTYNFPSSSLNKNVYVTFNTVEPSGSNGWLDDIELYISY